MRKGLIILMFVCLLGCTFGCTNGSIAGQEQEPTKEIPYKYSSNQVQRLGKLYDEDGEELTADINRIIDREAGVVCWSMFDRQVGWIGLGCLPIEATRLFE